MATSVQQATQVLRMLNSWLGLMAGGSWVFSHLGMRVGGEKRHPSPQGANFYEKVVGKCSTFSY